MNKQETWRQIWYRKGKESGGLDDILKYNGYEKTQIDMKEVAACITRELNIKTTDTVLEVGCGAGALAQYLKCNYVGVDYSETLVKKHIELLGNSVLVCEASNLLFKDKYFDKVICYGVFMYFDSIEYALQTINEIKRVAKGSILIGDLPMRSHSNKHLLFEKDLFKGWKITDGFYDPYRKDRFNATLII